MLRIPWPYNQNENETQRSLSCSTTALDKATRETRVSQSGKLYNLVRILYVYCTTLVQPLYNFVHCDLSYNQ